MSDLDVVIIGAGVVGTSIARELSRYKLSIAVLEKEIEPAFGVSKSNSGIIHPGTQNPSASLKGNLCVLGNKLTRQISKELGLDFKEVGELIVIFDEADVPKLLEIKEEAEKLGVPGLRMVDRQWLDTNEPNLSSNVLAALYAPTAGIISPYRLVYALAENAAANGVEVFADAKVVRIDYRGTRPRARTPDQYKFIISTPFAEYRSRYVINCAGLYADEISRMVGIDDFSIKPRKGQEFLLDKKKEHMANHLLFPLPGRDSKGVLIIKTSDGNPMIGPTAEEVEDKDDLATTSKGLQTVLENVKKMMPSIEGSDIIAYFAGLRPVAGSDFIIRHEDKVPGFINVAGIQSPGLTAAPAIALMVKELLQASGLKLKKKFFFKKHRRSVPRSDNDIVCRCETVSAGQIRDAIERGARTLDGIKFRTRCQAGRCHGGFCTARAMKLLSEETGIPLQQITKRGKGSEVIKDARA